MPIRSTPLVTDYFYHVFNRGVNKQIIFTDISSYRRAKEMIEFYTYINPGIKYSKFIKLSPEERHTRLEELRNKHDKYIEVICFCFMPNHFHFILKQLEENGISKFIGNFQNSFTKYINTKTRRVGHLFQGQFKAVLVENDYQLLHLSRYIHLNPYSSGIIKSRFDLRAYLWSSYSAFLSGLPIHTCDPTPILSQFKNSDEYMSFVEDRADYQRELEIIKHLLLEN